MSRRQFALASLVLLAACATRSSAPRTSPDMLTAEQLTDYKHLNAFDAIRQLRPQWLRNTRGQSSVVSSTEQLRGVRVYVDGILFGGVSDLRSLDAGSIRAAQFLDSREATMRFGTNHAEGAIVVTTAG